MMKSTVAPFFPPSVPVTALPSRARPRLFLMSLGRTQRWRHTRLYPAFRTPARLYRLAMRGKAALGLGEVWQNEAGTWALYDFLEGVLPEVDAAVVLFGTPGPAQKITVQLWAHARVVGYLKYGEKPPARARLAQEHEVLAALPRGVGPTLLKYGGFADGEAMVTLPVVGEGLPAKLPPPEALRGLLEALIGSESYALEDHPWVRTLPRQHRARVIPWLRHLSSRPWPVALHHGDFAPWNLLRHADGSLRAIDWEYGSTKGLPFLDLAYYLLQVAALITRWSPQRARSYAVDYLTQTPWPGLSRAEGEAITRLAAYHAYCQGEADGSSAQAFLQSWRRTLWESA